MELLYALAEIVLTFLEAGPPLVPFLVMSAVMAIPVTLVHELGHAVVARARLGAQVDVVVGSAGQAAELHLRGIDVRLNAFSSPLRAGGSASFDASSVTRRDVVWIALAGPAASAAGTAVTAWAMSHAGPGLLHDLLWVATLAGVFGVLNLVPLTLTERRGGPSMRTDGRLVLDALGADR